MKNLYTAYGMQDILKEEAYYMRNIEADIRGHLRMCGYYEISTPTLEHYDLFTKASNPLDSHMMYKLTDKNGQLLVLRPDLTVPAARLMASKLQNESLPQKLFYIGNAFRFDEAGGGKTNEFTQAGLEIIGQEGNFADSEVIAQAIELSLKSGLKDFQIDIGHAQFFTGIMESAGFNEEEAEETRLLVEKKDFAELESLLNMRDIDKGTKELILSIPQLFGGLEVLDKAYLYAKNEKSKNALNSIREILEILDEYKLKDYVSIDLGMVGSLKYYTGIIFKGYTHGIGYPYLSGGRYDKLLASFGQDLPATGFSIGLNMLMKALIRGGAYDNESYLCEAFVGFSKDNRKEAIEVAKFFRESGISVFLDISFLTEDKAIEYAKTNAFNILVYLKADGRVRYINLNNSSDKLVNFQDIKGIGG